MKEGQKMKLNLQFFSDKVPNDYCPKKKTKEGNVPPKDYWTKKNEKEGYLHQKKLKEAIEFHQQGVKGDQDAVKQALQLLGEIRTKLPQNNLVNAYYGSTMTLSGRDAIDPMIRFQKTLKGLKILDQAVEKEPESIMIRILRANVCSRIPELYFHRTSTAIEDYNYLLARYAKDTTIIPIITYYQFLYDLGVAYQNIERKDAAEASWEKLRVETKGTKYNDFFFLKGVDDYLQPEINDPHASPHTKVLAEGVRLHQKALIGDQAAMNAAVDFFAKALVLIPGEVILEANHADCLSLLGRNSSNSGQMFSSAIKAMKTFDNIVNQDPDNIKVRLLRANHSLRVPEGFFHRTATAIADYEYIAKRCDTDRSLLADDEYTQLLYDLGRAYHGIDLLDEADAIWQKLLKKQGGLKYKNLVHENLQKNSIPFVVKNLSLTKNKETYYQEAAKLHELGVSGNKEAAKLGLELWEKAHQNDPQNLLALAYYGCSQALMGRYSNDTNTIFGNAIKGLKLVNQAVSADEKNVRVRLLRAFLTYSLPEGFFHLTQNAINDFLFLKQTYEQDPSIFDKDMYHKILQHLDMSYQRLGQTDQTKEN
jgi:hypothetical protein